MGNLTSCLVLVNVNFAQLKAKAISEGVLSQLEPEITNLENSLNNLNINFESVKKKGSYEVGNMKLKGTNLQSRIKLFSKNARSNALSDPNYYKQDLVQE